MKAIQITINNELLAAMDRALKGARRRRSSFIRQSIANELKRLKRIQMEETEREAYRKLPVQPGEFDIDPNQQVWGDEWEPHISPRRRR